MGRGAALHWREFLLALFLVDSLIVLGVLLATAYLFEALLPGFVPTPYFEVWLGAVWLLWIFALRAGGSYDLLSPEASHGQAPALIRSAAIVVALTLVGYFFLPFSFPRAISLIAPIAILATLALWRWSVSAYVMRWPALQRRLLLLAIDESTTRLASVLVGRGRQVPYVPVAFVTDAESAPDEVADVPVFRGSDQLWRHVARLGVAEVAVGGWEGLSRTAQAELVHCFHAGVAATDARRLYEELTGRVLITHVGPNWYAELPTLPRRPYFGLKRFIDVIAALVGLVVLSPLLALLAVLVFVDGGGPILYRQIRLGRRGEPFTIHKFRTMRRDAEQAGARYAAPKDPRNTRVGRFLRPSGLDELPQLWDILRGKMSLIGPRPERPEFVEQLAAEVPLYRARLLVRPGIVGWAEVHVPFAGTLQDHLTRLEYDLYYIKHASLLMDIDVALRTLWLLLTGRDRSMGFKGE